jgi:hypothetical protein
MTRRALFQLLAAAVLGRKAAPVIARRPLPQEDYFLRCMLPAIDEIVWRNWRATARGLGDYRIRGSRA